MFTTTLSRVNKSTGRKVNDILDAHRIALAVSKNDESFLAELNKVGAIRVALPTFVTYLGSFAFRTYGLGMIWDDNSQIHEEPIADKRELAMGFLTGTTTTYDLREGEPRFLLGQAIDLKILVWIFGIYLAV